MINFSTRTLLHHTLGDYQIPMYMYEKITAASTLLTSPITAPAEIDRIISACLFHQQPVYLCIPSDVVTMKCNRPNSAFSFPTQIESNQDLLAEAIKETLAILGQAKMPVVIGGVELIRFKLQKEFSEFLDKTGFPYATMMLGKTVISEHHPQFIGLFEGDRSRDDVSRRIKSADCVLQLGTMLTDYNTGGFSSHLDSLKTISANIGVVKIRNKTYANVNLCDFIVGLTNKLFRRKTETLDIQCASENCSHRFTELYSHNSPKPLTIKRFFDRMSHFIKDDAIVIAETGVSLFSAVEVLLPEKATFIGQTFYGSIGYTVGATLGACLAAQERKVVMFIGDGAFQVTCQDVSTMIRNNTKPIIFLLNNDGYTIERVICDRDYNDIQPWKYHELPKVFGGELGFDVRTEGELEDALAKATVADRLVFIEIHTSRMDCSEALRKAGHSMAEANQLE